MHKKSINDTVRVARKNPRSCGALFVGENSAEAAPKAPLQPPNSGEAGTVRENSESQPTRHGDAAAPSE